MEHGNLKIEFDRRLYSRVTAVFGEKTIPLGDFSPSEYVSLDGQVVTDFGFQAEQSARVVDQVGPGTAYRLTGQTDILQKEVTVTFYETHPALAIYSVAYKNIGSQPLTLDYWVNNHLTLPANTQTNAPAPFWAFLPESTEDRADWVQPLTPGFAHQNYLGMNNSDYGGGTPVTDVWRQDAGVAVGHVELRPRLVALPVALTEQNAASLKVMSAGKQSRLQPGETLTTYRTFMTVHQGDYFAALVNYRNFMQAQGLELPPSPAAAYETIWCAWGYERDFKLAEVYGTLPKVKELGLKWVVLDDGWQVKVGDWSPQLDKFPGGEADMKALVEAIHAQGLKAGLWWVPLAVAPAAALLKNHPDYMLLNEVGQPQDITWWDAYYLCPASVEVLEYTKALVRKFIGEWGFDGLKLDGQHLNTAPPCFQPAHRHPSPEVAYEAVPEFFKAIYETAVSLNPATVIELCPCGTAYAFHSMPYFNQSVASDPLSSWQVRHKGKTLKALMGRNAAYFGDHVELSDDGSDFASTIGLGGIPGTKFTWPQGKECLDAEREEDFRQWLRIYEEKQLAQGCYLGELYDLGFDRPEAHAVAKDGAMYYAFYAPQFSGPLELRGLADQAYTAYDYVHRRDWGVVHGPLAHLTVSFKRFLLLEVKPVKS